MTARASKIAVFGTIVVALAGSGATYFVFFRAPARTAAPRPPLPLPPVVSKEGMEPAVRDAIRDAERAVLTSPASHITWGSLGATLHVHGFTSEARECYDRAASLNPESFRWPYLRGIALRKSDRERALDDFRTALRLAPDQTPIEVYVGELLIESGRADEADLHFTRATELSPDCSHAWLGRARVRMTHDDFDQALIFLERAAECADDHGAVFSTLARVRYQKGDLEGADRAARRAEGLKADGNLRDETYAALIAMGASSLWCKHRGNRLYELGRYADACVEFARAADARPDVEEYLFSLARAQTQASFLEEAAATYQRGLAIRPDDAMQQNAYGVVLCRLNRLEAGGAALRKAIDLTPDYEQAHFNLWLATLELDRLEEAIAVLRRGVEQTPRSSMLSTTLAWVLSTHPDAEVRKPDDALRLATRACELTGQRDPSALMSLAAARAALGEFAAAGDTARLALQLAESGGRDDLAAQCRELVSAYSAGKPSYRRP